MDCLQAAEFLKCHDNYLLLTHRGPDGDTIGSAVGLCELLRAMGKTAWLLPSLDATALLQESLSGHAAPEEFVPDTVVSVDVASEKMLPSNAGPYRDRIDLAIDHHPSNTHYAKESCVEADKAACGEIIWELCDCLGVINPAIAAPLYMAVSTDTGCFVFSNTTPNTHRVAAALMEQGIPFEKINQKHFRTKSIRRLQLESLILQNMKLYHDGTLAVAFVTRAMKAQVGATQDDTDRLSAFAGQIQGVRHAVTIKEQERDEWEISVRTDPEELNATAVCARLGGGGHRAASGCTVYGTMEEAEKAILEAIDAELKEGTHG